MAGDLPTTCQFSENAFSNEIGKAWYPNVSVNLILTDGSVSPQRYSQSHGSGTFPFAAPPPA